MSKVKISRFSLDGDFDRLQIELFDNDGVWRGEGYVGYRGDRDEHECVELLLVIFIGIHSDYLTAISVEQMRLDVTEGFRQLRQNDLNGNSADDNMEIFLVPKKQPEPHFSCKMNQNEDSATQSSGENENSQSKVQ